MSGDNVLTGGTGNSTIDGGSGADTIEGGAGSNLLNGGSGLETYVFNAGNGSDTINENTSTAGTDVLKLGVGITASDVSFGRFGDSGDLRIAFGSDSSSTIDVSNFLATDTSEHQIGSIEFADGTTLSAAQVAADAAHVYYSDNGNDSIVGGSGDDTLDGGSGNDTLVGGPGNNLIVGGSGNESIVGGGGQNTLIGGSGSDTLVAGANGDLIETGTGYALIKTGAGNDTVETTGGQDTIWASNGNDIYEFGVGSGQDTLVQDWGKSAGDADTLSIQGGLTAQDLTFTEIKNQDPLQGDDLVIGIKGTKDLFTIQNYFYPSDGTAGGNPPIAVSFQGGSILSYTAIQALATSQADWNGTANSITGNNPDNFQGDYTPPPQQLVNFGLDDGAVSMVAVDALSAADVASGNASWGVELGEGVRPQDVELKAEGDSVLLSIKGTHDSLFIPGLLDASVEGYALTELDFNDGTVWDVPTMLQNVDYGTGALGAAGTVINATTVGAVVTPTGSNDTINATDGVDVHFGYGDGSTILNLSGGTAADGGDAPLNTITLGSGITSSDVVVSRNENGTAWVFTLKSTGESLTVTDASQTYDGVPIVGVTFADGSSWDDFNVGSMGAVGAPVMSDEARSPVYPAGWTPETTVLMGGTSNSTLEGGANNTIVIPGDGFGGSDGVSTIGGYTNTFEYGPTDGNVTVEGAWGIGYGDQGLDAINIAFQSGITSSDIQVTRTLDVSGGIWVQGGASFLGDGEGSGNLVLTVTSTGESITIPYTVYQTNGFEGADGPVSVSALPSVTFANGGSLDLSPYILGDTKDITSSSVVTGMRGDETIEGGAGAELGVAYGNTAVLGLNQSVLADGMDINPNGAPLSPSNLPSASTYIFDSLSGGDTVTANSNSILQFGAGITESDVGVWGGMDEDNSADFGLVDTYSEGIVYLKGSGNYAYLTEASLPNGDELAGSIYEPIKYVEFANGDKYTWGAFLARCGVPADVSEPDGWDTVSAYGFDTVIATGSGTNTGYYANVQLGGNDGLGGVAFVRGSVSNDEFGGKVWSEFDASAGDLSLLPTSMQAGIDPASLQGPVTFTYTPSVGDAEITNYDPNGLVVKLPDGIMPDDVSFDELFNAASQYVSARNDLFVKVDSPNGELETLTIDGYLQGSTGDLTERPFTIEFSDGTIWNNSDIENKLFSGVDYVDDAFITTSEPVSVDLSQSGNAKTLDNVTIANSGTNTLELGRDSVDATYGTDTFGVSRDTDSIVAHFNYGQDIVRFASNIDPNDIEVSQGLMNQDAAWAGTALGYGYTFALRSTGQHLLTISGTDFRPGSVLPVVEFGNGVTWSAADLVGTIAVSQGGTASPTIDPGGLTEYGLVLSTAIRGTTGDQSLAGGTGDDQIAAGVGDDTLNGGGGHDTLFAGQGNDTFVFGHGSGYDTIVPYGSGAYSNTVAFSADVSPSDVSVVRPTSGNDVELVLNDSGESILLPDFLAGATDQAVQQVTFADGTSWNAATLVAMSHQGSGIAGYLAADAADESITGGLGNDTIVGDGNTDTLIAGSGNDLIQSGNGTDAITAGAGLDTIYGGSGADLIVAGSGNMLVYGGLGHETYQFGTSFGHDTVFADPGATGSDVVQFTSGIKSSMVSFSETSDGGILVSLDSNGDSILLPDHYVNGSPVTDITKFVFADGATASMADIDKLLVGANGAPVHFVSGTVIQAGPGNVEVKSDNGNDTLIAGTGNDTLVGGSGTDVLQAGRGNDLLTGGTGDETYLFDQGFGQDTVQANGAAVGNVIQFGPGIDAANATFRANGNNLVIDLSGSGGSDYAPSQVVLSDYFVHGVPQTAIQQVAFGDGTTVSMTQVNQALAMSSKLNGTAVQILETGDAITAPDGVVTLTADDGNDTLTGGVGKEVLVAGSGNDVLNAGGGVETLIGGAGNDVLVAGAGLSTMEGGTGTETYTFGEPFGRTTIQVAPDEKGANDIQFTSAVSASQVTYSQRGNALLIDVASGNRPSQIVLPDHFVNGAPITSDIAAVIFADGTSVSMAQINQQLQGGTGKGKRGKSATAAGSSGGGDELPSSGPKVVTTHVTGSPKPWNHAVHGTASSVAGGPLSGTLGTDDGVKVSLASEASPLGAQSGRGVEAAGHDGAAVTVGAGTFVLPGVMTNPPARTNVVRSEPDTTSPHTGVSTAAGPPAIPLAPSAASIAGALRPVTVAAMSQRLTAPAPMELLGPEPDPASGSRPHQAMSDTNGAAVGFDAAPATGDGDDWARRMRASADTAYSSGSAPRFGQRRVAGTIAAADTMIRALATQSGAPALQGQGDFGEGSGAGKIRLQSGATWSVTSLDRTMAAWAPPASAADGPTDQAHALLVNAMASFAPLASAASTPLLPPLSTNAYTVAATSQLR